MQMSLWGSSSQTVLPGVTVTPSRPRQIPIILSSSMHCSCFCTARFSPRGLASPPPLFSPLPVSSSFKIKTTNRVHYVQLPIERTTTLAPFFRSRRSNRQTVGLLLSYISFQTVDCASVSMAGTCDHVIVCPFQTVWWPTKGPRRVYCHSRVGMAYKTPPPSPTYHPPTFRDVHHNRCP